MSNKIFSCFNVLVAVTVALSACDSVNYQLQIDALDKRVGALETWQDELNHHITGLQTLLEAVNTRNYITDVTMQPDSSGWLVSFYKGNSLALFHGKDGEKGADGKDGAAPQISIRAEGGVYYWTLNDAFLTDEAGRPLPVTAEKGDVGAEGPQGVTPQLRIADDAHRYWQYSIDNGLTWNDITDATGRPVSAVGPKGDTGAQGIRGEKGDQFFQDVNTSNRAYVTFTLNDGRNTSFDVPRYRSLFYSFLVKDTVQFFTEREVQVFSYEMETTSGSATFEVLPFSSAWRCVLDTAAQRLKVTAPQTFTIDNAEGKIVVWVSDELGNVKMTSLSVRRKDFIQLGASRWKLWNLGSSPAYHYSADKQVNELHCHHTDGRTTDAAIYGGLYQWGRRDVAYSADVDTYMRYNGSDHTAAGPVDDLVAADAELFYTGIGNWYAGADADALWPARANDPCPKHWRVPTQAQWNELLEGNTLVPPDGLPVLGGAYTWYRVKNNGSEVVCCSTYGDPHPGGLALTAGARQGLGADASNVVFFLPAAGLRIDHGGSINDTGKMGHYWSSDTSGAEAGCFDFDNSGGVGINSSAGRAQGYSIRCVQDN